MSTDVRSWHVRDVTPVATRAAAIKGGADIPARTPFMLRPRCRTLRALSCIDPKYAYVDDRGGVGIRLEPAAAIVRQYGEQFPRPRERRQAPRASKPPKSDRRCSGKSAERALFLNLGAKSLNISA